MMRTGHRPQARFPQQAATVQPHHEQRVPRLAYCPLQVLVVPNRFQGEPSDHVGIDIAFLFRSDRCDGSVMRWIRPGGYGLVFGATASCPRLT